MDIDRFITICAGGGYRSLIDGSEFRAVTRAEKEAAHQRVREHTLALIRAQDGPEPRLDLSADDRRRLYQASKGSN
jgi:hypothetical protein